MEASNINPQDVELREQDRWLPIANVARLMKNTLPSTAKVSKDAKECMQECVSEYISFITSEASDKCLREKRKTINGEDILYSMHDLGFENYAEVLKIYLAKYREQQALKQERGESRSSKRSKQPAADIPDSQVASNSQSSSSTSPMNEGNNASNNQANDYGNENEHQEIEHQELDSTSATNVNSAVGSNNSSTSSIGSPDPFFEHYDNESEIKIKQEGDSTKNDADTGVSEQKEEDYTYDDFISEANDGAITSHQNIDELTKQITNNDQDIDTLTAGIGNSDSNDGYF